MRATVRVKYYIAVLVTDAPIPASSASSKEDKQVFARHRSGHHLKAPQAVSLGQ